MPDTLPSADDFFGPEAQASGAAQPAQPALPSADEFFGAEGAEKPTGLVQPFKGTPIGIAAQILQLPHSSQEIDDYMTHSHAGKILDAVGQGAKDGWGAEPMSWGEKTDEFLRKSGVFNDFKDAHGNLLKTFNEALLRPAAVSLATSAESVARGFQAGFEGLQGGLYQGAKEIGAPDLLARDIAALPEAFPLYSEFHGELANARVLGVVGKDGEHGWAGTLPPDGGAGTPADIHAASIKAEQMQREKEPAVSGVPKDVEPPPSAPGEAQPDIHTVAREIAPDTFKEYDALAARRDTYRRWIDELDQSRRQQAETTPPPAVAEIDQQIAEVQHKADNAGARMQSRYADQLEALRDKREAALDEHFGTDSPDMAQVRQVLQQTDYRMRDLAPEVSNAYRAAAERMPQAEEVGEEITGETNPTNELPPETPAKEITPETTAAEKPAEPEAAPRAPEPVPATHVSSPEQVEAIAQDVAKKLTAVGRPTDESRAAAQLIAAYYETRAQRFGGKLGTAKEMYDRDAPGIEQGNRAPAKELEYAQGGKKLPAGTTTIQKDGTKVIRLFKNADASTFIHETGHAWLEDLMNDSTREEVPQDLKADASTVREWLGAKDGEGITTRQHEKFARGFERYLMEGTAPSKALAGVFAKLKDWLTKIYQTVSGLRSPINDDIRDVFDRLLAKSPERTTIAPELERPGGIADIHEAEAERTPPHEAAPVADKVHQELAAEATAKAPEIVPELELDPTQPAGEAGPRPPERPSPDGGGNAPEPHSRSAGDVPEPGKVSEGGSEATPESTPVRESGEPGESGEREPEPGTTGIEQKPRPARDPDEPLIDKAGNIRLDNLNQPEDVDDCLRQVARENGNFEGDRFGAEGRQLHDTILAARQLTAQAMNEMAEARTKAALSTATEQDLLAYQEASNRLTMVARRLATLTHNWGLAGQAFRELEGLPASSKALTMADLAERTKGMTFNQLRQEAQLGLKLETPGQQLKFLNDARATGWEKARSMIIELFVNSLISGPITHLAYTIGNEVTNLMRAGVEGPIAAAVSAIRGREAGERIYAGEAEALLYSHTKGAADGWAAAGKAWRSGIAEALPGELDALTPKQRETFEAGRIPNTGAIPGKVGEIIRLPSNGVAAIHSFGRSVTASQELWRLAYRDAMDRGLEGEALDRHIAEFINSPPEGTLEKVNAEATRGVLMQRAKYGTAFWHLKQITEKNLAAKLVAPFMQIGANLLHEGFMERTPLGLLDKTIRDNLMGRNGAIAQDMQTAKMVTGITVSTAVMGLTLNGIISGGGPSDPKQRAVLMATGWQPYSIKVGERWIPYRKYLGYMGPLVAGVANMAEIGKEAEDGQLLHAAASAVGGFAEVVADESWFRGVSNFINAARNYDRPEGEKYLRDLALDFVPFSVGLGQVSRAIDPFSRSIHGWADAFKAKIPGRSETLLPRRDVLGDPIPGHSMISPTTIRHEPVLDEMLKVGVYPSSISRKVRGIALTDEQYDQLSAISGRQAKVAVQTLMAQPGWKSFPTSIRQDMIEKAFKQARSDARTTVMLRSIGTPNDIVKQAMQRKMKDTAAR